MFWAFLHREQREHRVWETLFSGGVYRLEGGHISWHLHIGPVLSSGTCCAFCMGKGE